MMRPPETTAHRSSEKKMKAHTNVPATSTPKCEDKKAQYAPNTNEIRKETSRRARSETVLIKPMSGRLEMATFSLMWET